MNSNQNLLSPSDPYLTPETRALYERLVNLTGNTTLIGHQDDTLCARGSVCRSRSYSERATSNNQNAQTGHVMYTERSEYSKYCEYSTRTECNEYDEYDIDTYVSDAYAAYGCYPAVWGFDLGRIELGWDTNIDALPFEKIRRHILRGHELGAIITLSWHSVNPLTHGGYGDNLAPASIAAVLPQGSQHRDYIAWLHRVADFVRSLIDSDGRPVPIALRLYHEHTGDWFWWCTGVPGRSTDNTALQYRELWQMTVDYLRQEEGIHNFLTVYSPDCSRINLTDCSGGEDGYWYGYPGDNYIDILGLDDYWDISRPVDNVTAEQCLDDLTHSLTLIGRLAQQHGKIAALTEVGSPGDFAAQHREYRGRPWSGYLYHALQANDYTKRVTWILPWRNSLEGAESGAYGLPESTHPYCADFMRFINQEHIAMLM